MYSYLDKDNKVVRTSDSKLAREMNGGEKRILRQDIINGYLVSTVFLGFDTGANKCSFFFDTAILPEENGEIGYVIKSCGSQTFEEAIIAHNAFISEVRAIS